MLLLFIRMARVSVRVNARRQLLAGLRVLVQLALVVVLVAESLSVVAAADQELVVAQEGLAVPVGQEVREAVQEQVFVGMECLT